MMVCKRRDKRVAKVRRWMRVNIKNGNRERTSDKWCSSEETWKVGAPDRQTRERNWRLSLFHYWGKAIDSWGAVLYDRTLYSLHKHLKNFLCTSCGAQRKRFCRQIASLGVTVYKVPSAAHIATTWYSQTGRRCTTEHYQHYHQQELPSSEMWYASSESEPNDCLKRVVTQVYSK